MKSTLTLILLVCFTSLISGQTNIHFTNPAIIPVLSGNYDPLLYQASTVLDYPQDIIADIQESVDADSLKAFVTRLSEFGTRNTGSDTISDVRGIGAARRWVYEKFSQFSQENEDRLIPGYLQFDRNICDITQHRNVVAVLPGSDNNDPAFILIEGHLDSRCEGPCDPDCKAEGVEDNASGTALVIEMARVLSQYTFDHTIVFMATIGEEQGLYGADAFSDLAQDENLEIKAVLNNDIVGGIICGATSSAPSCPGEGLIDSTQVRIFSSGSTSTHKGLARFSKLQYQEELLPLVDVPMLITIMSAEDRSGRGGDHIPFRQKGYTSVRYTSAHEHGDASNGPGYHDHQHTSDDILGVDTDNDGLLDSFFVDFNYLARNSVINGVTATAAALGPVTPDFVAEIMEPGQIKVTIEDSLDYDHYRISLRSLGNDWDTLFTLQNARELVFDKAGIQNYVSVASVDENDIESLFTNEEQLIIITSGTEDQFIARKPPVSLLPNRPNPFDEATIISWYVTEKIDFKKAYLQVTDLQGKVIQKIPATMNTGNNEVLYHHGYGVLGTYIYSLIVDDKIIESRQMVFAN